MQTRRFHHRLQVSDEGLEREVGYIPIRKTVATFVVTDEGVVARKLRQHVTPDRADPISLQVTEPICSLYQWRSGAHGGVSNADTVSSLTKFDLLFHLER